MKVPHTPDPIDHIGEPAPVVDYTAAHPIAYRFGLGFGYALGFAAGLAFIAGGLLVGYLIYRGIDVAAEWVQS